jgi:hypothetical protein
MRKRTNGEIRDADILAYLNEDLDPETTQYVAARIASDPALATRVAALQQEEATLESALYRVSCPETMILSEFSAGLLPVGSRDTVQKHLAACPYCRQEVAQLKTYLADVRPDLETNVFKRARVLVARLISTTSGTGALGGQPAFGLRGEVSGPRMYAAEGVQLSLEVLDDPHQPEQKRILGLIVGVETAGWQAQLWRDGQQVKTTDIDEFGNFALTAPPAVTYELIVHGDEVAVHVPELNMT